MLILYIENMILVTPNLALAVFIVILIISAIVAWRMVEYGKYDTSKFHTFVAILGGLGVFVTFMFYYNIVAVQQDQQQLTALSELSRLSDNLLNSMLNEMNAASKTIPNFVLSLTPLTNTICNSTAPEDPITPETCTEKMTLSYRIFSLWQDVVVSNDFTNIDPVVYITNFLQRANSAQLYQQWSVNRLNFIAETQKFGDLLFEYGLPISDQTPQEYIQVANQLVQDPRFYDVFN